MARIEKTHTVSDAGRDMGKVFHLTEMPPRVGHRWATRLLFCMLNAGIDLPDNWQSLGMGAVAVAGLRAIGGVEFDKAEPLLDELLACVECVPDPKGHPEMKRKLYPSDIEEIKTIFALQKAVWDLHMEPFMSGAPSISESAAMPTQPI